MIVRSGLAQLTDAQLAVAWQGASLLLDYPDNELPARAQLVHDASILLPDSVGGPLRRFVEHVNTTPLDELAAEYVATFDQQRRCCLFLTYFAHGDTRKRGMALLRFKQAYERAGVVLRPEELPDHLCVVLEFGATADREAGRRLLLDHRAGLEVLRLSLREAGSPWYDVVAAVCATLPPLRGDEEEAVRQLAEEGPPEEEVGLAPFAPPEFMPTGGGRR